MKKISEIKKANKKLEKQMKKDEKKSMEQDGLKLKIMLCENKFPTLDLIIMAIGRCGALFIKAFIIGLALKSALF